jgi:hypothetical protein
MLAKVDDLAAERDRLAGQCRIAKRAQVQENAPRFRGAGEGKRASYSSSSSSDL